MNTRFLTVLTTLAFLGFSVSAFAGKVVKCQTWPNCDGEPITYTAELTGAFEFNTVDVTEVAEGDLRSGEDLLMSRPGDYPDLTWLTWNQVFNACEALLETNSVTSISVASADWSIEKAGGVRVVFRDIRLPLKDTTENEDVLVRVQLIGNEYDFFDSYLPEGPGDEREYLLNQFDIMGTTPHGVHPRGKCHGPGRDGPDLSSPIKLVITVKQ
jgi:hypothetical protein